MGAAQAFSDNFLPKQSFSKRTLRGCTSRNRDNIVLIEVDSDDFGDVIILDVPESFKKKFRKKPKDVISIDDDDNSGGESQDGVCHTNHDSSTSDRYFPTEAANPSTSAYDDEDVNEGITPVKLSKSKRTYSGKSISRNRFGLSPNAEGCSSESDCSDCELVEGSLGKLREQWEKASFRKRHDASCIPPNFENNAGTSSPNHPGNDNTKEGMAEDAERCGQQTNLRKWSLHHDRDNGFGSPQKFSQETNDSEQDHDHDPMETDEQFTRTHDVSTSCGFDDKERGGTLAPECPVHHIAEQCTAKNSVPVDDFSDSAGKLAEQLKSPRQDCDAERTNEVFNKDASADVTNETLQDVEGDHDALIYRQQGAVIPSVPSDHNSISGHGDEAGSSHEQNSIITDRQKIKETEEYKHAMEEELAARHQQLLVQAEEARRLRNRKRAESMRVMMNERRQKQRVEEIRQTQRKDEENLNLKERHRVEIRQEVRRIEAECRDMASLLRYLGIHVGGGLYPSPNEVQAAYKRACLKFHPDRMSTTDLRQQVEAEEKFKLISNMKDKFLLK
ncbi:uncharacterized protein LOC104896127 isoform X2 [Beta vulgaris subsp. vulgaris]|nr:uncharacterized protein LOC104896127 isoform X2 [Beta vulgaris subsp. vulgaris]XP_010681132.2 uncharacterized protein LOC104896127 isoform X2 [Beta vulgaris subsp. vulgaris]